MSEEDKNLKHLCPYSGCDYEFSFEEVLRHESHYNIPEYGEIVKEELFCPDCRRRVLWVEDKK